MNIKTEHVCPPISIRCYDWRAVDSDTYDGAPDSPTRHQVGYGSTEQKAINDLKEQLSEQQPTA